MGRFLRLIDVVPSAVPVFVPATYAVTVAVNWEVLQRSRAWSDSQIFASHDDRYELWEVGRAASSGLAHYVKTGDERPFLSEIAREAAAGLVGDYLVATDALSFYDSNRSSGASNDKLVVSSSFPLVSMVTAVHVGPDWWFTGFAGISAAVPTFVDSDEDDDVDMVWLDSFTVPIFPYKVGDAAGSVRVGMEEEGLGNDEPGGGGNEGRMLDGSPHAVPRPGGAPELWAHPRLPPGGPVSRVVALNEADYDVPLAYAEFRRVPNVWEDSARGGVYRRWAGDIKLTLPFILIVSLVGAAASCLGGYLLVSECVSRLRRKNGGYAKINECRRSQVEKGKKRSPGYGLVVPPQVEKKKQSPSYGLVV